jgi:ketosteroid isomerase-like protein
VSQENVEIVRRAMQAMRLGDMDALSGAAHADYQFHTTSGLPGGGVYKGLRAVMAFSQGFTDTWESFSIEEGRVIDADATVVVLGRVKAQGKMSGVALDTAIAYVHVLREQKLSRTEVFFDHDEALRVAGLEG